MLKRFMLSAAAGLLILLGSASAANAQFLRMGAGLGGWRLGFPGTGYYSSYYYPGYATSYYYSYPTYGTYYYPSTGYYYSDPNAYYSSGYYPYATSYYNTYMTPSSYVAPRYYGRWGYPYRWRW